MILDHLSCNKNTQTKPNQKNEVNVRTCIGLRMNVKRAKGNIHKPICANAELTFL